MTAQYASENHVTGHSMTLNTNSANRRTATSCSATLPTSTIPRARSKPARPARTTRSEFACTRTRRQTAKCPISSPRSSASKARCLHPKPPRESFATSKVFRLPPTASNLDILPYALDLTTWQNLMQQFRHRQLPLESRIENGVRRRRWLCGSQSVSAGHRLAWQSRHRRHWQQQQQHGRHRPTDSVRHFAGGSGLSRRQTRIRFQREADISTAIPASAPA